MDIIDIEFEGWSTILLRLNWVSIIITLGILLIISLLHQLISKYISKKSIIIEEVNLGIGDSSVKLTYNKKDHEIAYKLWVELSTRKIGIPFEEENDVITEVYNSWYEFFKIARELLKEVPASRLQHSNELIDLTERVLNKGLRPHLTRWQAKYRKWYDNAASSSPNVTPQELQRQYPFYNQLVCDLLETNKCMIEYKRLMKKIAFDE